MSLVPYAASAASGITYDAYKLAKAYAKYKKAPLYNVPSWVKSHIADVGLKGLERVAAQTGRTMKSYAKKAIRYKRKKPKAIGETRTLPSKSAPGRKAANDPALPGVFLSNGNVIRLRMPWPLYDNGTLSNDNLVARTRNNILVKGISICHTFTSTVTPAAELWQGPLKVRWYLCQKRDGFLDIDPNIASGQLNSRFFKTNNEGQTRDRSFNNEVNSPTNVYDHAKICAPVNIHDQLQVITSREFILQGKTAQSDTREIPWQYTIKEYFKINKRLTFEQVSSVTPDCEIFVAMWIYPIDESAYIPTSAQGAYVRLNRHDVVHWGEAP